MKRIIYLTFFILSLFTKAQVASISSMNITDGIYLKDLENVLPKFVGEWVAKYEKNQVILNIEKVEKYPSQVRNVKYYRDVLFLRYTIKDSHGNEIYSTADKNMTDISVLKTSSVSSKSVSFWYRGEECRIGEGYITLTFKDPTHISWEYISADKPIDKTKCPNADNIKSYIPKSYELTFTKK
ncbi:hypothetical protein BAX94_04275 [Elizabethkingia meningoseptica]|uniref:DUF6705 domain-containing protein n=1 Tax=Elizabethkingia meningoseptica TaxID=238 RepID=A0A1V3U2K5_ELIME|nr:MULTISPECIES: DUF6705 family protein [Elizabethkingia]AQX14016.1 hypothetical protein BBD35_17290 [Elizabethkingia meningoseptica]MCL1676432.1 hypothetical protein [Elizabethkingia meningoseptica]MCL1687906.1 hypothetical protein [Elizabethkingia meningoseptica]MDX8573791.1 hypothetical protein [Elizabethkingia sp. HX WYD]ODM53572.1 hypothetical protein BES09_04960 [Elizabethkingia meningoseptica]